MNEALIQAENLTKTFEDGCIVALDHVNLVIRKGEFVSIMGPSGSGKTTLLYMIGALDRPTNGRVIVDGVDLARVKDLDGFRSQKVGFVFQLHNLIPTLTSLENVQIPMCELRISAKERRRRAMELLEAVGLGDKAGQLPTRLSGGERQRVAIARALANNPSLILADEPTGVLDSKTGGEIIKLMRGLNRTYGTTVIVVTHDANVAQAADRIVRIIDGGVEASEAASAAEGKADSPRASP